MEKEFNLSDLEMHDKHGSGYLYTEQVKEFIKRLNESIDKRIDFLEDLDGLIEADMKRQELFFIRRIISKLAGDKLK